MAGVKNGFRGKRINLVADGRSQFLEGATGEIRAPDRAPEKGVPADGETVLLEPEENASGTVAGNLADFHRVPEDFQLLAMAQPTVHLHRRHLQPRHGKGGHYGGILEKSPVAGMTYEFRPLIREFLRVEGMIPVPVGEVQRFKRVPAAHKKVFHGRESIERSVEHRQLLARFRSDGIEIRAQRRQLKALQVELVHGG